MAKLFVSNKDETVRMFKSNFMETMSHVHWSVPLWIFTPVVVFFLYLSFAEYQLPIANIIAMFVAGIFFWTFKEYFLHRFLFHYHPKSEIMQKYHWYFHGVHHDYPNDTMRLVMVPGISIPLAALSYWYMAAVFGNPLVAPFFSGFILGYLFYDTTHYAIHHFGFKNKFWLSIKQHHMRHHYKDSELGYGVSSPFWDHIFRTNYK
jgi:4-hydroxysphinganine ceramide fatty acyl 2-hydroxylase